MDGRFTNPPFLLNHLPFLLPLPTLLPPIVVPFLPLYP